MMKIGDANESTTTVVCMNHLIGMMLAITDQETMVGTPIVLESVLTMLFMHRFVHC